MGLRLDFVLVSIDVRVLAYHVLSRMMGSDHRPVITHLSLVPPLIKHLPVGPSFARYSRHEYLASQLCDFDFEPKITPLLLRLVENHTGPSSTLVSPPKFNGTQQLRFDAHLMVPPTLNPIIKPTIIPTFLPTVPLSPTPPCITLPISNPTASLISQSYSHISHIIKLENTAIAAAKASKIGNFSLLSVDACPRIFTYIGNVCIASLIDSGASVCLLDLLFAKEVVLNFSTSCSRSASNSSKIVLGDGKTTLEVYGFLSCTLCFHSDKNEKISFEQQFWVLHTLPEKLVLGMSFFTNQNADVSLRNSSLSLRGKKFPLTNKLNFDTTWQSNIREFSRSTGRIAKNANCIDDFTGPCYLLKDKTIGFNQSATLRLYLHTNLSTSAVLSQDLYNRAPVYQIRTRWES